MISSTHKNLRKRCFCRKIWALVRKTTQNLSCQFSWPNCSRTVFKPSRKKFNARQRQSWTKNRGCSLSRLSRCSMTWPSSRKSTTSSRGSKLKESLSSAPFYPTDLTKLTRVQPPLQLKGSGALLPPSRESLSRRTEASFHAILSSTESLKSVGSSRQ